MSAICSFCGEGVLQPEYNVFGETVMICNFCGLQDIDNKQDSFWEIPE